MLGYLGVFGVWGVMEQKIQLSIPALGDRATAEAQRLAGLKSDFPSILMKTGH